MKSKLLMLLLAGFSMVMLPACGDDDDDDVQNNEQQNNNEQNGNEQNNDEPKTSDSLAFSAVAGTYHGPLVMALTGSEATDNLGVVVSANDEVINAIDLTLEPINIMGIEVKDLDFKALPCTYDAAADTWSFKADDLHVVLQDGAVEADVNVKQGTFSKGGKLNFTINVKTGVVDLDLSYAGTK